MTDLHPTNDRKRLLRLVKGGHIYRSGGGCDMRRARAGDGNTRVDRRLRELREAGWVVLGPDGSTYVTTAAGDAVLEAVRPGV